LSSSEELHFPLTFFRSINCSTFASQHPEKLFLRRLFFKPSAAAGSAIDYRSFRPAGGYLQVEKL
jgi:hypothetical protein